MNKAFKLALLALGLAVFIDVLFYDQMLGLNVPIASLAFLGTTYLAMYLGDHKLPLRAHIAASFSFLFAIPFAIGTSEQMYMLSTLGFLSSHLLFATFTLGHYANFNHPLEVFWSGTGSLASKLLGRLDFFGKIKPPTLSQNHWAVGKGLLALVPLLIIFILLFTAADPVFKSYFDNLSEWLETWTNLGDVVAQTIIIGCLFLGLAPFFAAAAYDRYVHEPKADRQSNWTLESKIVLGGLTILFAVFLIVQGSAMFGGSVAFAKLDLTYAEYAREGFNQLIYASALVALIVLTLRDQHGPKSDAVLTTLHSIFIIETLLVLISAAMRLNLYVWAYGYTDARLFAYWTIITTAILLVLLLANVLQRESQTVLMRRALIVLGISALIFCYSMPEATAVKWNMRRNEGEEPIELADFHYSSVSPEAIPATLEALFTDDALEKQLGPKPTIEEYCRALPQLGVTSGTLTEERLEVVAQDYDTRRDLGIWFTRVDKRLGSDTDLDWRDWNYSRTRARDPLPVQPPTWLEVPQFWESIENYETACAAFIPPAPTGVDPNERRR